MADILHWALAVSNAVFLLALLLSYRQTVSTACLRIYDLAADLLGTNSLLALYALALIYLWYSIQQLRKTVGATDDSRRKRYVPYYDANGKLRAYVRASGRPRSSTRSAESEPLPTAHTSAAPPAQPPTFSQSPPYAEIDAADFVWDGWPSRVLRLRLSNEDLVRFGNLGIFWALERLPGGSGGSLNAKTAAKGKLYRGKCYGALTCEVSGCSRALVIMPETNPRGLSHQLQVPCVCGEPLKHIPCGVECTASVYRAGAVFLHDGEHHHGRYTHTLRASAGVGLRVVELSGNDWVSLVPKKVRFADLGSPGRPSTAASGECLVEDADLDTSSDRESTAVVDEQDDAGPAELDDAELDEAERAEMDGDPDANMPESGAQEDTCGSA
ncbi:hypothetical protein MKEN_00750700 [Mycena kentingensis (nom. inval.)]|nr:hypothetical protein MKEN_00750700 [Mycena kentingensis (nom. inval.)]